MESPFPALRCSHRRPIARFSFVSSTPAPARSCLRPQAICRP
jgi:hypothetical protein